MNASSSSTLRRPLRPTASILVAFTCLANACSLSSSGLTQCSIPEPARVKTLTVLTFRYAVTSVTHTASKRFVSASLTVQS